MDGYKAFTPEEVNAMKAAAVMEFVNVQIGAFESGFVETNETSLYSLYRFAQHHVKDNYGTETKSMNDEWGQALADLSRSDKECK